MIDAIANALKGDSSLVNLLTGGIYHKTVEISRQDTPDAFDSNLELLPCALLKAGTIAPFGPLVHSARQTFTIYLYQKRGFDVIEAARRRVYTLLHDQRIAPVNDSGAWIVRQSFENLYLDETALNCSLGLLRYEALIKRG